MNTLILAQELIVAHHDELKKLSLPSQLPLPFSSCGQVPMSKQCKKFDGVFRQSFAELLQELYSTGERVKRVGLHYVVKVCIYTHP